jgi:hypothetical protein
MRGIEILHTVSRISAHGRNGSWSKAVAGGSFCAKDRELFRLAEGALRPASANLKVRATWHSRSSNVPRSIPGLVKASSTEGDDRAAVAMQAEI